MSRRSTKQRRAAARRRRWYGYVTVSVTADELLSRLEREFLQPIVDRVFSGMRRRGLL